MTTLFRTVRMTNDPSRKRSLFSLGAVAAAAALFSTLIISGNVRGEVSPLQIIPLAQGSSLKKTPNMHVNGSNDTLTALLVFQPGAETGWHIHPGPVIVVIKSGALTETHANGCMTVHPTGSVFFETAGEVHNAANLTGGVAEVYATFISPTGAQPLIPVTNPGRFCHAGDDHEDMN